MAENEKKKNIIKSFFTRLFDRIDKKMKEKAKNSKCCCDDKKDGNNKCCS